MMAQDEENTDEIEASIVEYFYERQPTGHKCGYCGSKDTSLTNGMWAHRLAGQDYQDLIDRGWRRSGKYMYKPVMNKTCCPLYAIRCEALKFEPSRSQKRVANKMRAFLVDGKEKPEKAKVVSEGGSAGKTEEGSTGKMEGSGAEKMEGDSVEKVEGGSTGKMEGDSAGKTEGGSTGKMEDAAKGQKEETSEGDACVEGSVKVGEGTTEAMDTGVAETAVAPQGKTATSETDSAKKRKVTPRPGDGADPNKHPCRKAKVLRLERREKKLAARRQAETGSQASKSDEATADKMVAKSKGSQEGVASTAADKVEPPRSKDGNSKPKKTVVELLALPSDQTTMAHRLETKMVVCYPPSREFTSTFIESYAIYKKYQMMVHGDKEEELSERSFRRFLCDTPLIALDGPVGWKHRYGTFHYQYYLDGKLLMVAVMDILPTYLSSVYVYYDPDYRWLELGVYSALREIEMVQLLSRHKPEFQYYCMGYYVHNNPKMVYKGRYRPSFLLCPDTYCYAPIEIARPKLDVAKYSRLNEEAWEPERVLSFLGGVLILFEKQVIPYMLFRSYYGHVKDRVVVEYASLVGKMVSQRTFLYLMLDGHEAELEDSDD